MTERLREHRTRSLISISLVQLRRQISCNQWRISVVERIICRIRAALASTFHSIVFPASPPLRGRQGTISTQQHQVANHHYYTIKRNVLFLDYWYDPLLQIYIRLLCCLSFNSDNNVNKQSSLSMNVRWRDICIISCGRSIGSAASYSQCTKVGARVETKKSSVLEGSARLRNQTLTYGILFFVVRFFRNEFVRLQAILGF